ncbi:uncharacterized protein EV420DRAFT_1202383 [Desarmillaria tabescens]|uniref:Fungal-type protein kinase domain-containing protein n=1 Tax=Armillaria tabescens TaxID=1929756 RepID=A0AA39MMP0_ARMTA|nr:uncharacterized protein EV420DRAFT_1202383 [Desarmillaria tabescens]KAK0439070.1 hypothetical protein EV420DRAFT_1202383 [Desarmillaria tabescens]
MMLQYRSHLFTNLICGRFARFIRWDRSGAIVSKRFDCTKETTLIFEFYKRFAQLTPSQRGKDRLFLPLLMTTRTPYLLGPNSACTTRICGMVNGGLG